jgi:urocanate hydratase
VKDRYLDEIVDGLTTRSTRRSTYREKMQAVSIGVHCNAVELLGRLIDRGITPDALTDQTSAHDPCCTTCPRT